MKAIIDSNVLISALVFDNNELKVILELIDRKCELIISDHIREEVVRVLLAKFPKYSKLFIEFIQVSGIEVIGKKKYSEFIDKYTVVRDKHDRHILACAVEEKCDVIISGDQDLLVLKEIQNIKILKAKDIIQNKGK